MQADQARRCAGWVECRLGHVQADQAGRCTGLSAFLFFA